MMAKTDKANNNVLQNKKKESGNAIKAYLIAYNATQTLGWSFLLYQLLHFYYAPDTEKTSLYETVKWTLIVFQNGAILEVLHAFFKLVPSNPMITIVQVASRVSLVCGILMVTSAPRASIGLPMALFAWTITEIIRYANYALNLVDAVPYFLIWLRYTTFIVLYPIGVAGELLCIYAGLQEVAVTKLWTYELPNTANFAFHYEHVLIFIMLSYIPGFPQLYLHMFSQRKKVLGREQLSKKLK